MAKMMTPLTMRACSVHGLAAAVNYAAPRNPMGIAEFD
jgi:hypothetical protein